MAHSITVVLLMQQQSVITEPLNSWVTMLKFLCKMSVLFSAQKRQIWICWSKGKYEYLTDTRRNDNAFITLNRCRFRRNNAVIVAASLVRCVCRFYVGPIKRLSKHQTITWTKCGPWCPPQAPLSPSNWSALYRRWRLAATARWGQGH